MKPARPYLAITFMPLLALLAWSGMFARAPVASEPAPVDAPAPQTAPEAADLDATDTPADAPDPDPANTSAPRDAAGRTPASIVILEGDINRYNQLNVENRFAAARAAGARTIIFSIDTYGGYVDSGLNISRFIKRQDDLHVIAYIPDKAISAGAMIAVACDEIVMQPGAMIGNSGVVTGTGQELSGTARAKAESMVLEEFRDSARRNNHDPLLLESMIVVERQVHWVENVEDPDQRRFVDGPTYENLIETGEWRPVPGVRDPIDREDSLLTLGTELAVQLGLAAETATDIDTFAASRGLEIVSIHAPDMGDRVLGFLNSFAVRGILMFVFLVSLYMSAQSPGTGLTEAIALTTLGVLVGVPLLLGYAGWIEVIAILLGIALVAVEVFFLPGFGLPGITGALLILFGLVMSFVPPIEIPDVPLGFAIPWGMVQGGLVTTLLALLASLLLWWWMARHMPSSPIFSRLILTETIGGDPVMVGGGLHPAPEPALAWPPVGARGTAITDLRPAGSATFHDDAIDDNRIADVVSDAGFVRAGHAVTVRRIQGTRVIVRPEPD